MPPVCRTACCAFLVLGLGIATAAYAADSDTPLEALPSPPALDPAAMDRSVDPCQDFYQYACGGWMRNNPIPADRASWSIYEKVYVNNQRFLWGILRQLAAGGSERSVSQQKIGDYFAACMDESRVDAAQAAPVQPLLDAIDAWTTPHDLAQLLARLHQDTQAATFFELSAQQDPTDSSAEIAVADAGGLSLPDRDYYLRHDTHSRALLTQYQAHVARVFALAGSDPVLAQRQAHTVVAIETELARATLPTEETRDPYRLLHRGRVDDLARLAPHFDWPAYFAALDVRPGVLNVTQPAFIRSFDRVLATHRLDDIKIYLRWQVLHAAAPQLSHEFAHANFEFFDHTLRGVPEMAPRWNTCVRLVDAQLGDALSAEFVTRAFSAETRARALAMTEQLEAALADDLATLEWMSPSTRAAALDKLHAITNKIGFPDHWRDYSSIAIDPASFYLNYQRATRFESQRVLSKIGRPIDRSEWAFTAATVNAEYDDQLNSISFPAGILQPPLFQPLSDDAPNYGDTGATIGHEMTHGFDDEGRKYDAHGNLRNWWTRADARRFEKHTQCIVHQFDGYTVLDGVHVNGHLSAGENIADLGGLVLAYIAWRAHGSDANGPSLDGLTPTQRFFVGNAQWSCENIRDEELRVQVQTDPHAPARFRVNGPLANMSQFSDAFACHAGQPMVAAQRCQVW